MIVLGQQVRCRVTGFRGVVIGRGEYLYASPRLWIQSETVNDSGQPKDALWIDEAQCEPIEAQTHVPNFRTPGGVDAS